MTRRNRTFKWQISRLTALSLAASVVVALLVAAIVMPLSSRPAYADHDSMSVVCPNPIREGNTGQLRVSMPGRKDISVSVFTYNGDYTADASDYIEYHGVRMESEGDESSIRISVVTTEDTLPEHDETFSIGFWEEGVWHGCVVTIEDEDAPGVTHVDISSEHADWYAYRAGESIDVTVNTDAKVEMEGTPLLSLYIDGEGDSAWRGAKYHSGSGSRSLVFRYVVQPEDLDLDGITVGAAASGDDGSPAYGFSGNIFAEGTDVHIDYGHPGLQGDASQIVDGRPYVRNARIISEPPDEWQAYRANQTIEISLTFDIDVVVEGDVATGLSIGLDDDNWDEAARQATYLRGSGADTLVFGYTVVPGDMDPKGVSIALGSFFGNPLSRFGGTGAIKAKDTNVEPYHIYRGTGRLPDHKVDTEPPAVSSVTITSRPANGESYSAGEVVTVEVAFSEDVTLSGDVHMDLDVGGLTSQATLRTVPELTFSDSLVFQYTVQEGDTDNDGIGIGANSVKLNGGGIFDSAGNSAGLSHDVVSADSGQKVDTSTGD